MGNGPDNHKFKHQFDLGFINANLSGHNFFVDLYRLVGKEWGISCCHFIHQHSQGPPVHSFVVTLRYVHMK
jgi:hypothetical protein